LPEGGQLLDGPTRALVNGMRWNGLGVLALLLGCAHQQASGLSVDDEAALEVEVFRAAMLYPGYGDFEGDLEAVTARNHRLMCLGIYAEPSSIRVEDPSPRVVRSLSDKGALVAPASQCRNPGIEPPFIYDGSLIRNVGVLLHSFGPLGQEVVSVELQRGCFRSLGSSCVGYQTLFLKLGRTLHGWVTQEVVEGAIVD
jgi:hypothetical protein